MDIAEALQIVLDLAKHDIMERERLGLGRNHNHVEAYMIVEDLAVNEYGDD